MSTLLRFDRFEVDLNAGRLFKRGSRIRLREQSFRVLAMLLEHPGEVVTREDLRRQLWAGDVFIDFENSLNAAVARLREALGDAAERPRFIETLHKRGYRFIGTISATDPPAGPAGPVRKRLLVLPFVNLAGDAAQECVCDAMTDVVITELAALAPDALAVIARTTAMRHKGTQKDVAQIGRELGVDCLIEGAVHREGESVIVNVQLVRASDQAHVWAKRYESPPGDLFSIPGPVAQAVAGALEISVRPDRGAVGPTRAEKRMSRDPVACNEYIQGRRCVDAVGTREELERGRGHLEKAVARDPAFALAYEALAELHWWRGYLGLVPPRDAFAVGVLHAVRALEIDASRAETLALLAQYRKQLDYDWPAIERELTGALELDRASTLVRYLYSLGWLVPQGRIQDAIVESEYVLERDPLWIPANALLGVTLALSRQWDGAMDRGRLMIELDPASHWGHWVLGFGCRGKGLLGDGIAAQRKAVDLSGGSAMMLGWLGLILGSGSGEDEARGVLGRLEAMARTGYVPPTSFAWVYLGLRDVDRAFEWLDRAIDARDQLMMPIKTYAFFDPIRADPRFHALLRKMKLE